ncbi:MAG: hypothetical protein LE180_06555, partial [Endomicrobium sp.]|uniref:hypothetical protein n=1 Tax=Candidatus Endomicrobiellum pyrsonymphae TaxID=1408203 RepID=UPI00358901BC|nr:hypothetical protein [Endomicrobium sp.]
PTVAEQEAHDKHKRREEDLKKDDLSIEQLEAMQEELRLEAVALEPNKKRLGQITKQTDLLNPRLLERRYELSPKAFDQLQQELPEETMVRVHMAEVKAQEYIMDMEWQWDKMKCAKEINDILDSSSPEQVESLRLNLRLNMRVKELRELELQMKERNLLKLQPPHHLPITSLDVSPLTVVPQPRLSSSSSSSVYPISEEERLMLEKMRAEQTDLLMRMAHARGEAAHALLGDVTIRARVLIKKWSIKVSQIFGVVVARVDDEMKTKPLTYALAKTVVESMLKEQLEDWEEWEERNVLLAAAARKAERTLPLNVTGMVRQFMLTKIKLTTLATLRLVGALWDEKRIRLEPEARKLTISEKVALDTIMAIIKERALNRELVFAMYDIKGNGIIPHYLWAEVI